MTKFKIHSGLLGATESNQKVTRLNISQLPSGSVVRNLDGSRIIHLHDDLWLWCCDGSWCYDNIERLKDKLGIGSVLCHHP